jgi:hypothetical protein
MSSDFNLKVLSNWRIILYMTLWLFLTEDSYYLMMA